MAVFPSMGKAREAKKIVEEKGLEVKLLRCVVPTKHSAVGGHAYILLSPCFFTLQDCVNIVVGDPGRLLLPGPGTKKEAVLVNLVEEGEGKDI